MVLGQRPDLFSGKSFFTKTKRVGANPLKYSPSKERCIKPFGLSGLEFSTTLT
jgi:hypothetical protein